MGSAGGLGALRAPLAGFGAETQSKSNLLPFSPKISHQVATISIIFNAMQTTNFKVKNIWGGTASPASPLNPPMPVAYIYLPHYGFILLWAALRGLKRMGSHSHWVQRDNATRAT